MLPVATQLFNICESYDNKVLRRANMLKQSTYASANAARKQSGEALDCCNIEDEKTALMEVFDALTSQFILGSIGERWIKILLAMRGV